MQAIFTYLVTNDSRVEETVKILVFSLLTALGAFIYVPLPFTPVPLTMQVFFILLSAGMIGRKAAVSQVLYITAGASGLPIFSGAVGGMARLAGPTGGYLAGFVAAAYLAGWLTERGRGSVFSIVTAMAAGMAAIYLFGTAGLMVFAGIGAITAIKMGVLPFILGDALKIAAATAIVRTMNNKQTIR